MRFLRGVERIVYDETGVHRHHGDQESIYAQMKLDPTIRENREIQQELNRFLEKFGAGGVFFMATAVRLEKRIDDLEKEYHELSEFCRELQRRQNEFEEVVVRALDNLDKRVKKNERDILNVALQGLHLLGNIAQIYERIDSRFSAKISRILIGETSTGAGVTARVGEQIIAHIVGEGQSTLGLAQHITKELINAPKTVALWAKEGLK